MHHEAYFSMEVAKLVTQPFYSKSQPSCRHSRQLRIVVGLGPVTHEG